MAVHVSVVVVVTSVNDVGVDVVVDVQTLVVSDIVTVARVWSAYRRADSGGYFSRCWEVAAQ